MANLYRAKVENLHAAATQLSRAQAARVAAAAEERAATRAFDCALKAFTDRERDRYFTSVGEAQLNG